jgi:hypothetical protein
MRSVQPGSKEFRFSMPLFTFSQTSQVLKLYEALHLKPITPLTPLKEYKSIREHWPPFIKATLEEIGHPKFCKNPMCMRPLSPSDVDTEELLESLKQGEFPLNNLQAGRWPREYCSPKCRENARNSDKPKSTPRVKKHYIEKYGKKAARKRKSDEQWQKEMSELRAEINQLRRTPGIGVSARYEIRQKIQLKKKELLALQQRQFPNQPLLP